jgi:hypothetical protein
MKKSSATAIKLVALALMARNSAYDENSKNRTILETLKSIEQSS